MIVPTPVRPRGLKSRVLPAGSTWWNVTHHSFAAEVFNSSGKGAARFSPLFDADGAPVPVLYAARHPVAAMLETVFHNVWGQRAKRVGRADLTGRVLRQMRFDVDVRVVDLSDAELARHGIGRDQLVSTSPEHYRGTRAWADLFLGTSIGGQPTVGIGWQSRVVELALAATPPLLQTLLVGEQTEVVALYDLPAGLSGSDLTVINSRPLDTRDGFELVTELAVSIGAFVDHT